MYNGSDSMGLIVADWELLKDVATAVAFGSLVQNLGSLWGKSHRMRTNCLTLLCTWALSCGETLLVRRSHSSIRTSRYHVWTAETACHQNIL